MSKYERYMSSLEEWNEHQQYGHLRLTWSKVPSYMNQIFNIINANMRNKNSTSEEKLVSLTKAQLKDGINYLKAHEEYGFTYKRKSGMGPRRIFLVADCPKLKYRKYERSRGLGATYRKNFFVLRKFHTTHLKSALENYDDKKEKKERESCEYQLRRFTQKVESEEKRHSVRKMTRYEIRAAILATVRNYAHGNSGSSHGCFNFSLNECTHFIDNENGKLLPLTTFYTTKNHNQYCTDEEYIEKLHYKDLKIEGIRLLKRWSLLQRMRHELSEMWHDEFSNALRLLMGRRLSP